MNYYEEFTAAVERAVEAAEKNVSRVSSSGLYIWSDEEHQELKNEFIGSYLTRWYEVRYGTAERAN
jgi:hypothetical protein